MKWLFRFDIGGELDSASKEFAHGIGHARRCLTIAQQVRRHSGDEVLLLAGGSKAAIDYFRNLEITSVTDVDERRTLDTFRPSIIVVDINYLAPERISWYRHWAPVVNLAPRGMSKHYADVTFIDTEVDDIPPPDDGPEVLQFRGPEFATVGSHFSDLRAQLEWVKPRWVERKVVVSMGGVDYYNMTSIVMESLSGLDENWHVKVVLSPLYPHTAELEETAVSLSCPVEIIRNPADMARAIVDASIGIFGVGIITYEALSIGVPSVNVGLSSFHRLRGEELERAGAVIYAGDYDQMAPGYLSQRLTELISEPGCIESMRERGLALVDGRGAERIVNKIRDLFEAVRKG